MRYASFTLKAKANATSLKYWFFAISSYPRTKFGNIKEKFYIRTGYLSSVNVPLHTGGYSSFTSKIYYTTAIAITIRFKNRLCTRFWWDTTPQDQAFPGPGTPSTEHAGQRVGGTHPTGMQSCCDCDCDSYWPLEKNRTRVINLRCELTLMH